MNKPALSELTREQYEKVKSSGMFWVWYPEATGNYFHDCCSESKQDSEEKEHTGGSVDYYKVDIEKPASGADKYTAECLDIIEALGMNYAEGNAFKALWRMCAAKNLGKEKRGNNLKYDAEKVLFFAERILEQNENT